MSPEAWSTYWVGIAMGLCAGLALGYILWQLPTQVNRTPRRQLKREREEQDLRQWHEDLLNTPMRSIEDIAADREPEWVNPVLALGMEREQPRTTAPVYGGPPWWKVKDYFTWNFGDYLSNWSTYGTREDRRSERLL
jgi:hypothetical protein